MKKFFFMWLLIAVATFSFAQKTIYSVASVKPKPGMRTTFENNWKAHLAKYHTKSDARTVYEITSGVHSGTYLIVEGPMAYADMDNDMPNKKEHGQDLEKNFDPLTEMNLDEMYRYDDSASWNPNATAEKFTVQVSHVKWSMMQQTVREMRRGVVVNHKLQGGNNFSYNVYTKMMSGSDPVIVSVRNLKDGFKSLEENYYGPNPNAPNAFKDQYTKDYGQDAWDARQKLLNDNANLVSREAYMMVLRKDLSTPAAK